MKGNQWVFISPSSFRPAISGGKRGRLTPPFIPRPRPKRLKSEGQMVGPPAVSWKECCRVMFFFSPPSLQAMCGFKLEMCQTVKRGFGLFVLKIFNDPLYTVDASANFQELHRFTPWIFVLLLFVLFYDSSTYTIYQIICAKLWFQHVFLWGMFSLGERETIL